MRLILFCFIAGRSGLYYSIWQRCYTHIYLVFLINYIRWSLFAFADNIALLTKWLANIIQIYLRSSSLHWNFTNHCLHHKYFKYRASFHIFIGGRKNQTIINRRRPNLQFTISYHVSWLYYDLMKFCDLGFLNKTRPFLHLVKF